MPEQRGREHHRKRIGETLKEEIGVMLEGELADPRIALCTVTELVMSPDGKSARVFIQVAGDDDEADETIKRINVAKGYIKRIVQERMGVRHVPELTFLLDRSQEYGSRIDELLGRIKKRKK